MSMNQTANDKILKAFSLYKDVIWRIDVDISYWQSFLKWSIKEYQEKNEGTNMIFESGFYSYDIDHSSQSGWLKSRPETFSILKSELDIHRKDFMNWVMN